ncbi:2277_t:CDS:2 [Ambispora gerdemannii]|uniref:2277_t:CDS:1 n=1 Tax=Ambispora gerdemannii TaxID=144530 RepID=A0A9N9G0L0_9GLOM|nr:2277_t:CDS:2 [Ambispora gerdemannii]
MISLTECYGDGLCPKVGFKPNSESHITADDYKDDWTHKEVTGYKPLYNTNSSISKETSSVSEVSSYATFQPPKSNDILTKFQELWWIQGNIHPSAKWEEASLPYMLKSDVDWEKYSERTDMFNVHGKTKTSDREKEADRSFALIDKPEVNSNGCEDSNSVLYHNQISNINNYILVLL